MDEPQDTGTKAVKKALSFLKKSIQFTGPSANQGFIQWVLSVGDEGVTPYLAHKRYATFKPLEGVVFEKKWKVIHVPHHKAYT